MSATYCNETTSPVVFTGMEQQPNAYVYAIAVDGIVRYIGKGRGNRTREHLRIVDRLVHGMPGGPKEQVVHRRLAAASKGGATVEVRKLATGLTDAEAYECERREIESFGLVQLWNLTEGGVGCTSEDAAARWRDPEYRAKQKASQQDPSVIKRRSESLRKSQNRPEVRARVKAAQREAFARPECKARLVARTVKNWQDPKYRAAVVAGRKAQWTPEARARASETHKRRWANPEVKKQAGESKKGYWSDPARCGAHKEALKAFARSPEGRALRSEIQRARYADPRERDKARAASLPHIMDPQRRATHSARMKAMWADPAYKSRVLEARARSRGAKQ